MVPVSAYLYPWDAEVIDMPEAADALAGYYRAIAGEHPDWDEYLTPGVVRDYP